MVPAVEVVTAFNDRITARDLDGLAALMTDDHASVDAAGAGVHGRSACVAPWDRFFAAFPDYRNVFASVTADGDEVVVVGHSICAEPALPGGRCGRRWPAPAPARGAPRARRAARSVAAAPTPPGHVLALVRGGRGGGRRAHGPGRRREGDRDPCRRGREAARLLAGTQGYFADLAPYGVERRAAPLIPTAPA